MRGEVAVIKDAGAGKCPYPDFEPEFEWEVAEVGERVGHSFVIK